MCGMLDQAQQEWLVIGAGVAIYLAVADAMFLGMLFLLVMVVYSSWPKSTSLASGAFPPQPWVFDVSACRGGSPSSVEPRRGLSKV